MIVLGFGVQVNPKLQVVVSIFDPKGPREQGLGFRV